MRRAAPLQAAGPPDRRHPLLHFLAGGVGRVKKETKRGVGVGLRNMSVKSKSQQVVKSFGPKTFGLDDMTT